MNVSMTFWNRIVSASLSLVDLPKKWQQFSFAITAWKINILIICSNFGTKVLLNWQNIEMASW